MVKGCVNGNLDDSMYAAPVQIIGWYIAAGSAVCLLFMLFDIISAIRRRERWIPCRLFSLNSITLSLLAIISKVPVDLTTTMPGVHDQLSKLTATTMICVCIVFMAPSVASSSGTDYIANMASLTIFVITVVVNVCIQLYTGVIQLFFAEHIIIICCMLLLTLLLWFCAYEVKYMNEDNLQLAKEQFFSHVGLGSLFQRLMVSYYHGFRVNPQLISCKNLTYSTMAAFSIISFCVLIQASVRSLVLKQFTLCGGNSDYGWSLWMVVVLQILAVVVGCFASSFRWSSFFVQVSFKRAFPRKNYSDDDIIYRFRRNPMMGFHPWHVFCRHLQDFAWYVVLMARALTILPTIAASKVYQAHVSRCSEPQAIPGYVEKLRKDVITVQGYDYGQSDMWALRKVADDKERWMKANEINPLKHTIELVSRVSRFVPITDRDSGYSSFTMALLVQMATFCFPPEISDSLQQCFYEAYEIICFIEDTIVSESESNRRRNRLTKHLLIGGGLHVYLPEVISTCPDLSSPSFTPSARARMMLDRLRSLVEKNQDLTASNFSELLDDIYHNDVEESIYSKIERLFVDQLVTCLTTLPSAVEKKMRESSPENFGNRARRISKMLIDIWAIEQHVPWNFIGFQGISTMISEVIAGRAYQTYQFGKHTDSMGYEDLPPPPPPLPWI